MQRKYGRDGQSLEATTVPSHDDTLIAAGFYEGEGYCGRIHPGKKAQNIQRGIAVHVGQKDPEPLYWLRARWGGSVRIHHRSGVNQCDMYMWLLSGDRARVFLSSIYPYLLSQRRKDRIDQTLNSEPVTTTRPTPARKDDDIVCSSQECEEGGRNDRSTVQ